MHDVDSTPTLLGGRYLVGAVIGRGGMAVVHRAWDSVLNRDVAVKLMSGLVIEPAARARFEAEGQTLAGLNHPGLTMLHDAGTENDRPYLVMELVEGDTLTRFYRRHFLEPVEVAAIGADLADALTYVHACGIAHRDVKPSNVLIGPDRRVRLADFGVARLLDSATWHTATGLIIGTPAYLSPEQVRGEPVTRAGDIYALSLVLLEVLAGRPVYSGAPHLVALARLISPPKIEAALPEPLRDLLAAMTADLPADRPTAADVAGRLHDIGRRLTAARAADMALAAPVPDHNSTDTATDDPVTIDPVTTDPLAPAPITEPSGTDRRKLVWAGTALAAVALVGALILSGLPTASDRRRPPQPPGYSPSSSSRAVAATGGQGHATHAQSTATVLNAPPTRRRPASTVAAAATTSAQHSSEAKAPKKAKKPKKANKPKKATKPKKK